MNRIRLFGSITKSEEQEDGTVIVSGVASSESTDSQGEVITAAAMKSALPDYMKFANIREMHDAKKAAGIALEADVGEDGNTVVTAHVVDPVAVKKVLTGVYKGFSIGGRVKKRDELNKSVITELSLTEISLVDRPANPDAVFSCYKAEGADDEVGEEAPPAEAEAPPAEAAADDAQPPAETDGEEPAVADPPAGEVQPPEEAAAEEAPKESALVIIDAVIDGANVSLRKRADGTFEVLENAEIAKGCYTISRLADLADSLRYFADSLQWDVSTGAAPQAIPDDLREAAKTLYNALLKLVNHDVEQALMQLDAAGSMKSDPIFDLAKAAGIDAQSSDDLAKAFNDILASNSELKKRVEELEAQPAAPKGQLRVVEKAAEVEDELTKTIDNETLPPEQRALAAITKAHQGGGARIF